MQVFPRLNDRPIRLKILLYFLPLLLVSVVAAGLFSYLFAESQLKKNAYGLLGQTTAQTALFLDERLGTMFEELHAIEEDPNFASILLNRYSPGLPNRYLDIIALNNRLNALYQRYFEVIDSIYIRLNNGYEYSFMNETAPMRIGLDLDEWLRSYSWSARGYYWLNDHVDRIFATPDDRHVISCFKVIGNGASRVSGVIVLNLKSRYFAGFLGAQGIETNGYLALVGSKGILASRPIEAAFQLREVDRDRLERSDDSGGSRILRGPTGERLFVVDAPIAVNRWRVAAVVPLSDLFEAVERIKRFSLTVILVLSALSALLANMLARSISSSLTYLSNQVKKMEVGDFDTEFAVQGKNELGVLAQGLTDMEATVKGLLEQVREEQETKRKIELSALQAQINPHFLCNTLSSIKHLIDMNDAKAASSMVTALTVFFMIGVSRGKETITIAEELKHAESYLRIQQMRYAQDLVFEFDVAEEILGCKIMKLTLQPLIENAIYHGIKNRGARGTVRISGWRQDASALLEVFDDGPGMSPERLAELRRSIDAPLREAAAVTFGLRNVHERLRLRFGQAYGVEIESEEGAFTRVVVRVPFDADSEEEDSRG